MAKTHYTVEEIKTASISLEEGIGGSVQYRRTDSSVTLLENLRMFSAVIHEDGTIDGRHKDAERVALVLTHQEKRDLAYAVFRAIIPEAPKKSSLFLRGKKATYISEELSPVKGKLGYEGMFRFAGLALHFKDKPLATTLFLLIVEHIPIQCVPINLQDVRFESLKKLKELGVTTVCKGMTIDEAIKKADDATY